jgi:hypothetical protein
VEKLKGELATESTAIVHLRQNVSAAAQQEAQTVAQLQGQVRLIIGLGARCFCRDLVQ